MAAAKSPSGKRPAAPVAQPVPSAAATAGPQAAVAKASPASAPVARTAVDKSKKPKRVRSAFTLLKPECEVIKQLKQRTSRLGQRAKKGELLRAGIKALAAMSDAALAAAMAAIPSIKTGRPARRAAGGPALASRPGAAPAAKAKPKKG